MKQWKDLYKSTDLSLDMTADIVGIPKKSLDDYWYLLQRGYEEKFNFQTHSEEKISLLREYLKNMKEKNLKLLRKMDKIETK